MYKFLVFNALVHATTGLTVPKHRTQNIGAELNVSNEIAHTNCDPTKHQSNGYDCFMNGKQI